MTNSLVAPILRDIQGQNGKASDVCAGSYKSVRPNRGYVAAISGMVERGHLRETCRLRVMKNYLSTLHIGICARNSVALLSKRIEHGSRDTVFDDSTVPADIGTYAISSP